MTTRDRADWRFLLPEPPAGTVLWVAGADVPVPPSLASSLDVVRATDAAAVSSDRAYDLVAAAGPPPPGWRGSGPSGWDLAKLAGSLRPGGSLYLEVLRWAVIARPSLIRREMRQRGLLTTGMHALIPDVEDARMRIPLDDPRPARTYVRDVLWGGSRARRLLRTVARRLALLGRMDAVVRAIGVTAIRGDGTSAPALPPRERSLVAVASRALDSRPAGGSWMLQRPGPSVASPVIVRLWRDDTDRDGTVLAKVGISDASSARIVHEQHALHQLGPYRADPSVAVPSPLGSFRWGEVPVTLESAVAGRPMPQWLADRPGWTPVAGGPWDAWVAWLARAQARSARPMTTDELHTFVLDPLATAGALAGVGDDAAATARLGLFAAEAGRRHERAPLVVVTAHHDLGPSNVLVADDGTPIGIVDWESSAPGLPATDLLYFIAQLAVVLEPRARPDAARATGGWVRSYVRTLALDPGWLPTLAIAAWVMHARNEAARDTRGHAPGGRPARDRLLAALNQDLPATVR